MNNEFSSKMDIIYSLKKASFICSRTWGIVLAFFNPNDSVDSLCLHIIAWSAVKLFHAYTVGGEIINWPVMAQFNSVTELSLVQGES